MQQAVAEDEDLSWPVKAKGPLIERCYFQLMYPQHHCHEQVGGVVFAQDWTASFEKHYHQEA